MKNTKEPGTGPHYVPDESTSQSISYFVISRFMLFSHLHLYLPNVPPPPTGFLTKNLLSHLCYMPCLILFLYRVIQNDCWVLTTCHHNTLEIAVYVFFYLIEQHSKFLLHTLQVLYMCTLCDSTNINTVIDNHR